MPKTMTKPTSKRAAVKAPPQNSDNHRAMQWVYLFSEGNAGMRDLLGGKGAGVAEMMRIGLPVPPGFTITTAACNAYFDAGQKWPAGLWEETLAALKTIERQSGRRFGSPDN